jgi:hypothetical protein
MRRYLSDRKGTANGCYEVLGAVLMKNSGNGTGPCSGTSSNTRELASGLYGSDENTRALVGALFAHQEPCVASGNNQVRYQGMSSSDGSGASIYPTNGTFRTISHRMNNVL